MKAAVASVSLSSSFWCPVFKSCLTSPGLLAWRVLLLVDCFLCSLRLHVRAGANELRDVKGGRNACMHSFIHKYILSTYHVPDEWGVGRGNESREVRRVAFEQGFVLTTVKTFIPKQFPFFSPGIPYFLFSITKIRYFGVYILRPAVYQDKPHCSDSHPLMMSFHTPVTMSLGQSPGNGIAGSG